MTARSEWSGASAPVAWARCVALGAAASVVWIAASARAGEPPPATHAASSKPATAARSALRPAFRAGKAGRVDTGARRAIAGGATGEDVAAGVESPELRSLREAELELFPPASPAPGRAWSVASVAPPLALSERGGPWVEASGLPPGPPPPAPPIDESADLGWLAGLELPDLPVRWDPHVVRYLVFFRDDVRGRTMFANLYRHSGRYRDMIRRALRRKSLPEDLVWVAMIESAFDPVARSPAGAGGLWQFMPETARIYGLVVDRWLDQRYSAELATDAAMDFLGDLHRRFGSWELALAGYNMGYRGLVSVVRRYNTNDFWTLTHTEGTLPWETTLYVPKVLACAIVAHNLAAFGLSDVVDVPAETDEVNVPAGTPLAAVGQALGCAAKEVEACNPELRAARTPPTEDAERGYVLKVPKGKGANAATALARLRGSQPALDKYVVRFGETLDQIAAARRTTVQRLTDLNALAPGEVVRGGSVLLVPHADASTPPAAPGAGVGPKQSVVVPSDVFVYPDRKRVFYRVLPGDTLKDVASALHVGADDLRRWNALDASARLGEGMTLQAFVAPDADLSTVVVVPESDVRVLPVGSDEFFAALEHDKNMKRVVVPAKDGDTPESIGRRYGVSGRMMERINRRPKRDALKAGDTMVLYVPNAAAQASASSISNASNAPEPRQASAELELLP